VLALATLGSRLIVAVVLGVAGNPRWWEYDLIAVNLWSGWGHSYERLGFVYAAYAPPLWSAILALLFFLPGDSRASVQIAQALLCLGAAVTVGILTRRIGGDERTSVVAGLLVAFQPSLLYYSVANSDPLPLNACLLGLIVLQGAALIAGPTRERALGFGLLVGLGVLSRGTPIVALPVVAGGLFLRFRGDALKPVLQATVAFFLCVSPWLARNVAVIGAPLITSTTGENFWRGNHAGASGGGKDLDGGEIASLERTNQALPLAIRAVIAHGTELDRHQVFMAEALKFIRAEPAEAVALFGRKMRTFWWKIESDPGDYSPIAARIYEWVYRCELALALLGLGLLFRNRLGPSAHRIPAVLAVLVMIAISLLQSAFYVQGRHRFLIEPLLLMFASFGVVHVAGVVADWRLRIRGA